MDHGEFSWMKIMGNRSPSIVTPVSPASGTPAARLVRRGETRFSDGLPHTLSESASEGTKTWQMLSDLQISLLSHAGTNAVED